MKKINLISTVSATNILAGTFLLTKSATSIIYDIVSQLKISRYHYK